MLFSLFLFRVWPPDKKEGFYPLSIITSDKINVVTYIVKSCVGSKKGVEEVNVMPWCCMCAVC